MAAMPWSPEVGAAYYCTSADPFVRPGIGRTIKALRRLPAGSNRTTSFPSRKFTNGLFE